MPSPWFSGAFNYPMISFRIYPFRTSKHVFNKKTWYEVCVFKDKYQLRRNVVGKKCKNCKGMLEGTIDCLGLTHACGFTCTVDNYGNFVKPSAKGMIGTIYLERDDIGAGVVSHEMTHAMLYVMRQYTNVINFMDDRFSVTDEQMAGIAGNLNNSFYTQWEELKGNKKTST